MKPKRREDSSCVFAYYFCRGTCHRRDIRGWSIGSGLLLLGNLCVHFGLGRGRARARPGCVSYDFCFFIGHSHFLLLI